jgi:hypothetical protein
MRNFNFLDKKNINQETELHLLKHQSQESRNYDRGRDSDRSRDSDRNSDWNSHSNEDISGDVLDVYNIDSIDI